MWGKVVDEGSGSSSFYPEGGNSIQASPEGSRFNLLAVSVQERRGLDEVLGVDGMYFTYLLTHFLCLSLLQEWTEVRFGLV